MWLLQTCLLYFIVIDASLPGSPENVNVTAGSTTLTFTWKAPERTQGSRDISYLFLFERADRPGFGFHWVNTSADDVSHTMRKLKPETSYKFLITARNEFGEGPASSLRRVSTKKKSTPPVLTLDPAETNIIVANGSIVTIKCTATGEPAPDITWELEGEEVIRGETLNITAPPQSVLATCYAENHIAKNSISVDIIVNEPPLPPEYIEYSARAKSITLTWKASKRANKADTLTYHILHERLDHEPEDEYYLTTIYSNEETLSCTIDDLTPDTQYKFVIAVANEIGEGLKSPQLNATTMKQTTVPILMLEPAGKLFTVAIGGNLTINCTARGHPEPVVGWMLDNGETSSSGILQLSSVMENRKAICHGENEAGKTMREIQLFVKGEPPGSPVNLTVTKQGENVTITWQASGYSSGILKQYILSLIKNYPRPRTDFFNVSDVLNPSMNFSSAELDRNANYTVYVVAVYRNGEEFKSRALSFLTERDEDERPEVTCTMSEDNLNISWVSYELYGIIEEYKIDVAPGKEVNLGAGKWTSIKVASNVRSYLLSMDGDKIKRNEEYALRIAAVYNNGDRLFSATTTFFT